MENIYYTMSRQQSPCRLARHSSPLDSAMTTLPPRQQENKDLLIAEYDEFGGLVYGATHPSHPPHTVSTKPSKRKQSLT